MMSLSRTAFLFLLVSVFGACSKPSPEGGITPAGEPFASPSDVTAKLAEGGHIDIQWRNNGAEQTGTFLEFNMNPGEPFGILEILDLETTSVRHPDVAPETHFGYRVRPYFGRASDVVEITTGPAPPESAPAEVEGPLPSSAAPSDSDPKASVRSVATLAAARPTGLTAALSLPTTVDLRWHDRASDEEGYLADMSLAPGGAWQTVALLPADATSFRKVGVPAQTRVRFRVRAYFLGPPASSVTVVTPPEATTPAPTARPLLR